MKAKRILTFLMILVLLVCMLPTAYAAGSDTTEPVDPDLDPALAEAGFTSDSIQASYVTVDGTASKATRGTRKYATLRNCWQMDFITNTGYHQGFHFADEDGSKPWNYMNMIYCLENKKDFSIGSGNAGSGDLTLDGTGNNHGEQIWYNLSYDQRYAVGLIILYGAPSKLWDETWGINPEGDRNYHNPNVAYRWATQALIWEITGGWREATYPYTRKSDYWYAQSTGVCMSEDGQTDYFVYAYDSIVNDLLLHNTIPSFAGDYVSTAKEIELTGSTTTVTDLNGVLYKFDFSDTDTVFYSRNGNDLTITTSGPLPTEVQGATAEVPSAKASIYEVWYNQYDSSKQTCIRISIPAADPVPAYFKLRMSTGTLNIIKTATNGGTVAGWHFTIKNSSGTVVGTYVTDSSGVISVKLPAGTYTVTETDAEMDYWLSDASPTKTVTVTSGTTTPVYYLNQWVGKLQIIKKATNNGSVEGWHFTVKNSAGEVVGNYVTDSTGVITLDLQPGTYYVNETDGFRDYWKNDNTTTKTVTVTAGKTASVSFVNHWFGRAQIIKKTTNGGRLGGWHFAVKNPTGELVGNYVTDETGIIILDLDPGTYTVTETDKDETYWINDPEPTKTITVTCGVTATVTFVNKSVGQLQIIKKATNEGSVAGWKFTVTDSAGKLVGTYTTDETGILNIALQPGTYTVEEVDEKRPYWRNDLTPTRTITVTAGTTFTTEYQNSWNGEVKIIKELSIPGAGTLADWSFDIYNLNTGEYMGNYKTDENGLIVCQLVPGEYRIMEYLPDNSPWHCVSGFARNITVEAGKTTEVTFVNALRAVGKIDIQKVDPHGQPLAGVEFLLEWSTDGQSWKPVTYTTSAVPQLGGCTTSDIRNGKLKTDSAGILTFSGLHPKAYYRLTETATLDGYQLLADHVYEGTLDSDLTLEFTVVNEPVFTLPQTGSKSLALMPVGLLVCMAVCMGALFVLRKKRH